jgi:hypothetical protein
MAKQYTIHLVGFLKRLNVALGTFSLSGQAVTLTQTSGSGSFLTDENGGNLTDQGGNFLTT